MSIPVYHILESNGVAYKKGTVLNRAFIKNNNFTAKIAKYAGKIIIDVNMNTLLLSACREIGITVHVLIHNNFRSYRSIH